MNQIRVVMHYIAFYGLVWVVHVDVDIYVSHVSLYIFRASLQVFLIRRKKLAGYSSFKTIHSFHHIYSY